MILMNKESFFIFGDYPGDTLEEAIEALYKDAGYLSLRDAAQALDKSTSEFLADIVAIEGELIVRENGDYDVIPPGEIV